MLAVASKSLRVFMCPISTALNAARLRCHGCGRLFRLRFALCIRLSQLYTTTFDLSFLNLVAAVLLFYFVLAASGRRRRALA